MHLRSKDADFIWIFGQGTVCDENSWKFLNLGYRELFYTPFGTGLPLYYPCIDNNNNQWFLAIHQCLLAENYSCLFISCG